MRRIAVLLLMLFAMSSVFAYNEIASPTISIPPQQFSLLANITVNGIINQSNTTIAFVYEIFNPYNKTASIYMNYNFDRRTYLRVILNGKEVEPEVISESKYYQGYRVQFDIKANRSIRVTSVISQPTFRSYKGIGLWSNTYHFHFPIYFETRDFRRYVRLYGIVRGEIKIPEEACRVTCTNCRYYKDENIIRASYEGENPRFSFSFKIKRVPYKAGMFYLIMLAGIFSYVIRKREKVKR